MKKVLIVFPDFFLPYSPTTLNIYEALEPHFDVSILTFEPDSWFSVQKVTGKKVKYLPPRKVLFGSLLVQKITQTLLYKLRLSKKKSSLSFKAISLISEIRKFKGEIIAVDFFALWCVQMAGKKAHLVSLEIYEDDFYRKNTSVSTIKSIIIQTEERYRYLLGDKDIKRFYVQNAPVYIDVKPDTNRKKNELLFCGSAVPGFGIFSCLEFIKDFPEYTLTMKGAVPPWVRKPIEEGFGDLLSQKRLIIDESYMSAEELNKFVSLFRIGFVFYDYNRFEGYNRFNYKTAPSGKLFQYYNAGVPVIASDIPGLNSVREYKAGVMINSLGSMAIKKAIDEIETNYDLFARNAKELSKKFDFNKNIAPFVEYLHQ